jgi:hypothetical protein
MTTGEAYSTTLSMREAKKWRILQSGLFWLSHGH